MNEFRRRSGSFSLRELSHMPMPGRSRLYIHVDAEGFDHAANKSVIVFRADYFGNGGGGDEYADNRHTEQKSVIEFA